MDELELQLVSEFRGYNSSRDKTNISPGFLIRGSKNVYKKISGTIAVRPGLKRRGTADATIAGVDASYEWPTSLGAMRVLRVSNTKFQVESDIVTSGTYVWYDLMTSLTLSRFIFDPWWDNTDKKDKLLFVMGDFNTYAWSGGLTLAASGTINTITKLDTSTTWAQDGFASTGTVTINSVDYTYSGGANTTILTGVGTDASTLTSGLVAIQKVVTTSNKPASGFYNDFIKVIGNRLHCGSYTSRLIYISDDGDYTSFAVPATTRAPGDPELLTLDNASTGITVRGGNAHISAGTSDWYEVIYTTAPVIVAGVSVIAEQTQVNKKPTSYLSAALGHEFIDTVGNDIVYLSQDQQVRILGTFKNIADAKYPSLSQAVQDELADEDFSGGHLRAIGDFIHLTAPLSGRDYMHETRESIEASGDIVAERLWHPPQVRNIARFAVIDGVIFGHSNANPQIYQVWDTDQWHDDGPDGEPLPYTSVMRMAYQNIGKRFMLETFDESYFEGYIASGTLLYANVYFDYQGSTDFQTVIVNSIDVPTIFFSADSPPSLGTSSLGDNPLGDGLSEESNDQELLAKFRSICNLTKINCFEHALEVYSEDVDSRWEILSLGVNAAPADETPAFLSR